jgi:hypothetical protein
MTPLQNDPQQHQQEAKHQQICVPRMLDPSADSGSTRQALQKSGLDSLILVHTISTS